VVLAPLNYLTSRGFHATGADHLIVPRGRVQFITGKRPSRPVLGICFLVYGPLSPTEMGRLGGMCFTMQVLPRFLGKIFHGDALRLLRLIPDGSIDACIADSMYGTAQECRYDWGLDPGQGDAARHWAYHQPIYQQCLRVLRPGGLLAWAQGVNFCPHFREWFGDHGLWTPMRLRRRGRQATSHLWVVQTKERRAVPNNGGVVVVDRLPPAHWHPCPKLTEEMAWLLEHLTRPGQTVLDPFSGIGATLLAAEQLGRLWIGCDLSRSYCRIAKWRLAELRCAMGLGKAPGFALP
jgi:site-specific DNA-methyltransferase (adenine-specific)